GRLVGEPRTHDPAVEGGGRAAVHAGDLGVRGDRPCRGLAGRLPRMPAAGRARDARAGADGGGAAARRWAVVAGSMIRVRCTRARGSTPREVGAEMLVGRDRTLGSIGGGQLEYLAIDRARQMLARGEALAVMDIPLGPEIGQCCGGR